MHKGKDPSHKLSILDLYKIVLSYRISGWKKGLKAEHLFSIRDLLALTFEECRLAAVYVKAYLYHLIHTLPFRR